MCDRGDLAWIHNANELNAHLSNWHQTAPMAPLGFLLSMEGADSIESPGQLPEWWEAGLRIIGPAHFGVNQYVHGTGTEGGFKPEGFGLLREMEQVGFILDMTHLADLAFLEAADRFQGPVLASHHNSRTLVPGQRQLSDVQMRILLDRDAVIGVTLDAWMLTPGWVRGKSTPQGTRLEAVVDHIDYVCQKAGDCSHVGIGSDLDGGFGIEQTPEDLDTIADLQKLAPILESRGYTETEIKKIFHGNWISFFQRSLAA
jgi:membrane dipeptidase